MNAPKDPLAKEPAVPKAKEVKPKKEFKNVGVPVTLLPGWTVQQETIDAVDLDAKLVPSDLAILEKLKKEPRKKKRYDASTGYIEPPELPRPTLGESVLKLQISPKIVVTEKEGKVLPPPAALERTYLAVNSPAIRLQPGTWVRIAPGSEWPPKLKAPPTDLCSSTASAASRLAYGRPLQPSGRNTIFIARSLHRE